MGLVVQTVVHFYLDDTRALGPLRLRVRSEVRSGIDTINRLSEAAPMRPFIRAKNGERWRMHQIGRVG